MAESHLFLKTILILFFSIGGIAARAQVTKPKNNSTTQQNIMETTQHKMQVEIWSDIMCPFCYIGKRKFEAALALFESRDQLEIIWKSYQLAPDMVTDSSKNINQYLSEHKGISIRDAERMNAYVTSMAAKEGLTYNFDKAVVANSFKAHCFAHFAKQYGKQDEAEEKLFQAYFTEGKNMDDDAVLIRMGAELGLDTIALQSALESGTYADEVRADILEAEEIGVRGVPFFVFDRKYAVSGAQDSKVFLQTLEKAQEDRRSVRP